MNTEIELKYLVINEQVEEKITQLLSEKGYQFTAEKKVLGNCYFDTKALDFRQHDFGLRVRRCGDHREQTIKTAGQHLGGLHQRPEYNIDIDDVTPELSLFPENIWPANININTWQQDLIVLFSTDFSRCIWTVTCDDGSQIELAFDVGTITSSERVLPICEIELELLSGNVDTLFLLAHALSDILLMRPGIKSKAARGYQLWHQQSGLFDLTAASVLPIKPELTAQQNFVSGLAFALTHLQQIIANYFEQPSLTLLNDFQRALFLLRHGFWVFEDLMTPDLVELRKELSSFIRLFAWANNALNLQELMVNNHHYRKKIEYSQQLVAELKLQERRFPEVEQVFELIQSARFNHLQISLLKLIVKGESGLLPTIKKPMESFAAARLTARLAEQKAALETDKDLSSHEFLLVKRFINRHIQTSRWLGGLFDEKLRVDYYAPWLDMMHGITELETLDMLREQLSNLEEKPPKLLNWLTVKIESLLVALNASRQCAMKAPAYWLLK